MADEDCKQEPCDEGAPEYMLTYGDMMTLLLCFFVLLLSMAEIDAKKFEMAASSFQNALNGVLESMPTVAIHEEVLRPKLGGDAQNKKIAADAARKILQVVEKDGILKKAVSVKVTEKGVAIRISDPVGFKVGSDKIEPKFQGVLLKILGIVKEIPERTIKVEGHTDNIPMKSSRFPSNWELSAARALSVVKLFYKNGEDPKILSAVGYGEFHPVAPNNTNENRQKNRRIEIFVEYPQDTENKGDE